MGRLTWEQAEALVDRAYHPDRYLNLHPSIRMLRLSIVETPESRAFGEDFLQKWRKRVAAGSEPRT